ncbi:unnamed protein product [Nesidiocoris tenuis]|uniref:t-SNARE coiled-coil homology domain-containing protein n=1 Tax=Nesidiocoris tenuis TaxID=355587 RepID=A0A6H5GRT9_9HEMI|nr:unnamed protein product [Nesidiocoris tenuis]
MDAYLSNKGRSFFEEEDVDDDSFLRNSRIGKSNTDDRPRTNVDKFMGFEERRNALLQKQKEIEERTLKSTERSLLATAEELMRQREQLERSERRLDEINSTLRISQKHIQGIKSVFGGLKNFISGTKNAPSTSSSTSSQPSSNGFKPTKLYSPEEEPQEKVDKVMSHPGMRIRSMEDEKPRSTVSHQQAVDDNLSHMLNHMVRLKGLACDLSEEIDSQNELIDNIHDKTERADRTIHKQNKEISKLAK